MNHTNDPTIKSLKHLKDKNGKDKSRDNEKKIIYED